MDIDGFWHLVECSARETGSRQERLDWLKVHLARLPVEEIVDYKGWFTVCANRACTWDMYAACWMITGSGSSDGFEYFASWLISLGRETFDEVVESPDRLVEVPEMRKLSELSRNFSHERTSTSADGLFRLGRVTRIRSQRWPDEDYPEFEELAYVPSDAYPDVGEAVQAKGVESKFPFLSYIAEPDGEEWDFGDDAEVARRLPRLSRHYLRTGETGGRPAAPWRPQHLWRGDVRVRVWSFVREGEKRISRRLRYPPCGFGWDKACSWPLPGDCTCLP